MARRNKKQHSCWASVIKQIMDAVAGYLLPALLVIPLISIVLWTMGITTYMLLDLPGNDPFVSPGLAGLIGLKYLILFVILPGALLIWVLRRLYNWADRNS